MQRMRGTGEKRKGRVLLSGLWISGRGKGEYGPEYKKARAGGWGAEAPGEFWVIRTAVLDESWR